jgi:hypothetical protein
LTSPCLETVEKETQNNIEATLFMSSSDHHHHHHQQQQADDPTTTTSSSSIVSWLQQQQQQQQQIPVSLGKASLRIRLEAYYTLIAPETLSNRTEWLRKYDQIYEKVSLVNE